MTVNQVGSTATNYNVGMGASSSTTASTTATRGASSATSTSSARTVSSTTPASGSTASPSGVGKVSSTTPYSPATAQTTSSTTVTYSGPESTAKVSSTTATTGTTASKATESTSTAGVSASSTASTTAVSNSSGTPTASVAATTTPTVGTTNMVENITLSDVEVDDAVSVEEIDAKGAESSTSSTTPPTYAYLSHMGGEALQDVEKVLVELGYDDVQDGNFIDSLQQFKNDVGMSAYNTYSYEVVSKLSEVNDAITRLNGDTKNNAVTRMDKIAETLKDSGFINEENKLIGALYKFKEIIGYEKYDILDETYINKVEEIINSGKLKEVKDILDKFGFFNNAETTIADALEEFKDMEGTSGVEGMTVIDKLENINDTIDMTNYVTEAKLKAIGFSETSASMALSLNIILQKYGIIDKNEINHFIAQCVHESFYGDGMTEINWTTYPNQDEEVDREYFNKKYENTNGNLGGDDGYKYRGGGYIHLSGRENYTKFSKAMNDDKIVELGAEYVAENYAWEAAAHYWKNRVHSLFETGKEVTVAQVTYKVNGGYKGLPNREKAYAKACAYIE